MTVKGEFDGEPDDFPLPRLSRYFSERSPQPMVAVDGITHIVSYVNPAFAQLVGKEASDLVGRPFAEAVPEEAENGCSALLDRVFRTGIPENLPEQQHRQAQPQPVYWSYAMWAILGADERPRGVMLQVTDSTVTALFRRQAVRINESLLISATRQHERTEVAEALGTRMQSAVLARDRFLAVLSHEIRTPLAAFSNGLQLLKLAADNRAVAERSRELMERQLKQMVRLVDDLLDMSRITTGKLELHKERVELTSVIRNAAEASRTLLDGGGHQLTIELPPTPIWLDADSTRLTQVFLNLFNNAAKYSEPGQHIRVTARLAGRDVEVSIVDQGIGIATDKLPHIFEAFVQVDTSWKRTQGGMGIGLSLVKEFVELHGGRVEARSEGLGHGCHFLVRLPVAVDAPIEPAVPSGNACVPRRRILVVDDNIDAAESQALILTLLGHEVRTAYDGETAVAVAAEFRPRLVLMDLGMPKMDGYETAGRMRAQPWGSELYLVALTGWGAEEDLQRTQGGGFDRHLVKPMATETLTKLIAEMPVKSN